MSGNQIFDFAQWCRDNRIPVLFSYVSYANPVFYGSRHEIKLRSGILASKLSTLVNILVREEDVDLIILRVGTLHHGWVDAVDITRIN